MNDLHIFKPTDELVEVEVTEQYVSQWTADDELVELNG